MRERTEGRSPKPEAGRSRPGLRAAVLLVLFAVTALAPFAQQGLQVTSSVDHTRLRVGENLIFTVTIQAPNLAITQPALPPLPGLRSVGQYQTIETTPSGRALAFHYLLTPTRSGHLEVPDFDVRVGGQSVTFKGFSADVETSRGAAVPVQTSSVSAGQDVFLTGSLSADRAYAGQPVTYTLHLLTRRSVRGLDVVKTPDFSGFRKVEDPDATKSPTHRVTRDGQLYLDAVVIRATLFPLQAGHLQVGPYTAELRMEPDGRGGPARVAVTGGQASLDALPLPPGPPDFAGAVGAFTLSVASPAPGRADLGQPFSIALQISGAGFLPEQPLQFPSTPFFNAYPATTEDTSGFAGGAYFTRRVVTLPLLPKLAGDAALPPTRMVFFDPSAKAYRTLEAGAAKLVIGGGAGLPGVQVNLAPLIADPAPGSRPPSRPMAPGLFLWLLLAPFLANVALAGGLWAYRALFIAPEKARLRVLARASRRALGRAHRHMDVRRAELFHENLSKALTSALDIRTGRATAGLTRTQLEETLLESGFSPDDAGEVRALADLLEAARYSPERPTRQDLRQRYDRVARWVKENGHA